MAEVKYRTATMAEIEGRDTDLYMDGERVWVLMIERSQTIGEDSEPRLQSITLTNMKKVQPEQLQVIDDTPEESPMMKQFRSLKEKHPDAILLFRCGDFYETYKDDAKVCAKVLGITLTKSTTYGYNMAGFPHHALDTYLPKLVRAGHRVAICDQLDPPPSPKAKRGITETINNTNEAETSNNNSQNSNQKLSEETTMTANDFIGKIIKAGEAAYIIKSVEGNILQTEFRMGSTTMACPVNVELANKNIEAGKWCLADAGAAANENETPTATKTKTKAEPKATKTKRSATKTKTKAEPTATTTGTKTEPETCNVKPETKAEPETKLKCIDYTNKKGKKCAKIVGFSETDEAYTNAIELHASGSYERNKKGEKVYYIAFGPRYAEVAHAVCATLNTPVEGTFEAAKAIIDKQTADNAQKREEWKAKREERKQQAQVQGSSKPKGYSAADVAAMLNKVMAGGDIPEDIKKAMQKAA